MRDRKQYTRDIRKAKLVEAYTTRRKVKHFCPNNWLAGVMTGLEVAGIDPSSLIGPRMLLDVLSNADMPGQD